LGGLGLVGGGGVGGGGVCFWGVGFSDLILNSFSEKVPRKKASRTPGKKKKRASRGSYPLTGI